MEMITHEAVGQVRPGAVRDHVTEHAEKRLSVGVVEEDRLVIVPAGHHVVGGPRSQHSRSPAHGAPLVDRPPNADGSIE